jgi:hypothetical protein
MEGFRSNRHFSNRTWLIIQEDFTDNQVCVYYTKQLLVYCFHIYHVQFPFPHGFQSHLAKFNLLHSVPYIYYKVIYSKTSLIRSDWDRKIGLRIT